MRNLHPGLVSTYVSYLFVYLLQFGNKYIRYCTRFEAGTPAIGEAIALGAACDYLSDIGMPKIHEYEVRYNLTSMTVVD